jgi:glycerol-3-phosphate acyltransferase PlsY
MPLWLCPLFAFLLGSVPFGLLIARRNGVDIRAHGSGNIGATNVLRVLGKRHGIICLILDLLKGYLPVLIAINLIQIEGKAITPHLGFLDPWALQLDAGRQLTGQFTHIVTGLLAILGHNYSPWVGFRGGKGIATSAGVVLGLMPFAVILLVALWLLTFALTRYVSLASVVAALALPVMTHLGARFHETDEGISLWEAGTWNKPLFAFTVLVALLAVWRHRSNLRRLAAGTENRFQPRKRS